MKGIIMIAYVNPVALPALTVAMMFFLTLNVLAGVRLVRHRRALFGRDEYVEGDRRATRYLAVIVLCVPLLFLTGRLLIELISLWLK
jgi:hypothetical protein